MNAGNIHRFTRADANFPVREFLFQLAGEHGYVARQDDPLLADFVGQPNSLTALAMRSASNLPAAHAVSTLMPSASVTSSHAGRPAPSTSLATLKYVMLKLVVTSTGRSGFGSLISYTPGCTWIGFCGSV